MHLMFMPADSSMYLHARNLLNVLTAISCLDHGAQEQTHTAPVQHTCGSI